MKRGWEEIHCQSFRDVCSFCQVPLKKRDDSVCYPFAKGHCEQCNVCFDCLVHYNSDSLLEGHRSTWYEAHYRNSLKHHRLRRRSESSSVCATERMSRSRVRFRPILKRGLCRVNRKKEKHSVQFIKKKTTNDVVFIRAGTQTPLHCEA